MAGQRANVSNFSHLAVHDEQLARLGALAEHYFPQDPNTCLLKLRQFTELMVQDIAARFGEHSSTEEKQVDLLRRLQARPAILREVGDLFISCAPPATMPVTACATITLLPWRC